METATNPVGWFEIPVTDMGRARAFYEHVLQCTLDERRLGELEMAWFPMREGAPGAAGSLVKGEFYEPAFGGVLVYLATPDINGALDRVQQRGGQVIAEKTGIGEHGYIALAQDTEGNRFGLHSLD